MFVISGSSGAGKSTLIEELSRRGYVVVREAGRQLAAEQQSIGGIAQPGTELFGQLLLSRSMYLYNRVLEADVRGPIFFDRSIIEPIAYWRSTGQMAPHLSRAVERFRYATDVFMAPPWPEIFEKDAERQHSYDPEQKEYARLIEAFEAFGYRLITLPKTSVDERADFVEAHVRRLGHLQPGYKF
jgi:predicted ATPase